MVIVKYDPEKYQAEREEIKKFSLMYYYMNKKTVQEREARKCYILVNKKYLYKPKRNVFKLTSSIEKATVYAYSTAKKIARKLRKAEYRVSIILKENIDEAN